MKKLALALVALAFAAPLAAQSIDPSAVIAVTIREDGSTNVWTAADAMNALGMLNRRYWREMESEQGRRDWHGKPTTYIDTNALIRVWTYPDGFAWTNSWTRPKSDVERAQEAAARAAAAEAAKAAGKPSRIAEIYRKRAAAITNTVPEVVEVVITPEVKKEDE